MPCTDCRRPEQRGFTLVEVLVALVVMAVGMLGIASLYVVALRSGGSAINRMQAVNLASDMADRIRANRAAGVAYGNAGADNNCYGASGGGVGAAACTAAQLAANDVLVWQQQVNNSLPAGAGVIAVNAAVLPVTYSITVSWSEPGAAQPMNYTLNLQI